jgi:hypothetical protein
VCLKKIAKRQAATEMYHKIKNFTNIKIHLAKYVPEMNPRGNGIVDDARVFTSAGFHPKSNTADVGNAPAFTVGDEKKYVSQQRLNI